MRSLEVKIRPEPSRQCSIRIGSGVLCRLVEDLSCRPGSGLVVLISDSNVAPLHGEPLVRRLQDSGVDASLLVFPAGERSKTRGTKDGLEDRLLELRLGRDGAIVAVGGGVTGDLAGFVAATWQRGVPVYQVPTSLLAMVDASIGGKTGVDLPGAKNMVGAFHQPQAVYADPSVLDTLPDLELRQGLAEVVKTAVIANSGLFSRLERDWRRLLERDSESLELVVLTCATVKSRVVAADAREAGRRQVLNFGHTLGHGIEAAGGFRVPHGDAVAVGMAMEAWLAIERHGFPAAHHRRLLRLLERFGLPTGLPDGIEPRAIRYASARDKKNRAGRLRFALPIRIGRMPRGSEVSVEVDDRAVDAVITRASRHEWSRS